MKIQLEMVQPTSRDYEMLGITPPANTKLVVAPTIEEIRTYGGIDLSYGTPLKTETFFAHRNSEVFSPRDTGLFAPKDEDFERLGIQRTPIVDEIRKTARVSSYDIGKDGFAYTGQDTDILIDALAQSSMRQIETRGYANMRLLHNNLGLVIFDSRALRLHGTKLGATLFPESGRLVSILDSSKGLISGKTRQGLNYALVV